ncbi:MAG: heat-inducible transcriptional repressor HrcA [Microcoleaceae cyanobacterium]
MSVQLTHRQQHILWATVRHYIETAEPVGSKALVQEYDLKVSPATIRSGMGVLERAGLLYQPHTSSGRVTSDSGNRIYVDQLITPSEALTEVIHQSLQSQLQVYEQLREHPGDRSIEAIVRGAAQILSTLIGYITLITLPQNASTYLRHLQLVSIEPGKGMLVVVTDSYQTQSVMMELPGNGSETTQHYSLPEDEELIDQELQVLSNFLNRHLRGRPIKDLSNLDWQELDREFWCYADVLCALLSDLSRRGQFLEGRRIEFRGVSEVLRLPEFSQVEQTQTIIHLLEDEPEQLWQLLLSFSDPDQVMIRIGSENPLTPIQSCTLVSARYCQDSIPVGSVSVLGPTRMEYERTIALVEATADYLTKVVSAS